MADSVNLISKDGVVFDPARWTTGNASTRALTNIGLQETSLGSGVGSTGFLVTSVAAGEFSVKSPLFPVSSVNSYQVSGITHIGTDLAGKIVKIEIEYFDVGSGVASPLDNVGQAASEGAWVSSTHTHEQTYTTNADVTSSSPSINPLTVATYPYGFQRGTPLAGAKRNWVPSSANYARVVFTCDAATAAGQSFFLTDVATINASSIINNPTLNATYNLLPEFIRSSDNDIDINSSFGFSQVAKRLLASAYGYGVIVGEELRTWKYKRSTDSITGIESKSVLTDPLATKKENLEWMAQLVGVVLNNPYTGLSMWLSLPDWDLSTDSTNWQSIDILDAESVEDSVTWAAARSSSYENIDAYRQQILYAFNGLNAGKPESMNSYLGTVLDTETPASYFTRIKKHYRESPFLVKYVFDAAVDPDIGGTLVQTEMEPTLAMGTIGSQSSKARDAGEFAYEAKDILEANVPGAGATANDESVLKFGNDACSAIPDVTGSGRHINLFDSSISDPKASRYGIIAGARYNTGFAFYPSGVSGSEAFIQAATVSTGLSNTTGETDYIFHVSDVKVGNSSNISLFKQGTSSAADHCECEIYQDGRLRFHKGSGSDAYSTAYDSATHDESYDFSKLGDRWIRFATTTTGGDNGNGTISFYVAPTLHGVCHPTDYLINTTHPSAAFNRYDKTATARFFQVTHANNGIVGYRAIIADGKMDSSLSGFSNAMSAVIDLNLTISTSYTTTPVLYDGIDTFTQSCSQNTDVAYTIAYQANPLPIGNWIGLPHTGTDYLYLGNQSSSGDSIVVSAMDNDTYNWTVTYTDASTATGTATGVTTITWAAATYGGKQIEKIQAVGTKTYTFLPSIITAHTATTSTGTDSASGTWTINRAWEAADAYEHSSIIDRDLFQLNREGGSCSPQLSVGRDTPVSLSIHYRRFKTDSGNDNYVFQHPNFQMKFSSSGVTFTVTDAFDKSATALNTASLTWDDTSRVGQWNHVGLVRDVSNNKILLYANGSAISNATDTTNNGLSNRTGSSSDANVIFHTDNEPGWQFNHFAIFKEALSSADMERVRQTLPT
jgi:hypothetical protein